jgi:hypothetical protein
MEFGAFAISAWNQVEWSSGRMLGQNFKEHFILLHSCFAEIHWISRNTLYAICRGVMLRVNNNSCELSGVWVWLFEVMLL